MQDPDEGHDVLDQLRAGAAADLSAARAMPPLAYRSEALLAMEQEQILKIEWHCVGRCDEFARTGDYVTYQIGVDPVVVVRDGAGELRAYANVCRHRLAPLMTEARGNTRNFLVCPYHRWTYGLDGALKAAPYTDDGLVDGSVCLPRFAVEVWEGWVYVSLNPEASPLAPRLAELSRRLKNYHVDCYRTLFHVDEVWHTNWKMLYENFSESYHVFALHSASIDGAQPTGMTDCSIDNEAGFYYYEQGRKHGSDTAYPGNIVVSNPDLTERERNTNPMICVYPTHAFAVAAERMFWMSLQPEGVDKVRVRWGIDIFPGAIPPGLDEESFRDDMRRITERVNDEDRWMLEKMFRNAGSSHVETSRITSMERTTWEFQRYLVRMVDSSGHPARSTVSQRGFRLLP